MNNSSTSISPPGIFLAYLFICASLLIAIAFAEFYVFAGDTAISTDTPEMKTNLMQLFPQGWAFFTKSPRDPEFLVFRDVHGVWTNAFAGPEAEPSNFFGFSRTVRAQGTEIGFLNHGAKEFDCGRTLGACFHTLPPRTTIHNDVPHPLLCGHIALLFREPEPWAWAHDLGPVNMPIKAANLNVVCGGKS